MSEEFPLSYSDYKIYNWSDMGYKLVLSKFLLKSCSLLDEALKI